MVELWILSLIVFSAMLIDCILELSSLRIVSQIFEMDN